MIDHHSIATSLSHDGRAVLRALHRHRANRDEWPTRRELRIAAGMLSFELMDRAIALLIAEALVERTAPRRARNLRVTSLGRGVVAELLRGEQLTLV